MGILFIRGGPTVARAVLEDEQRGYWSAALPLVLEKHGYLDIDEAEPAALDDARIWTRYATILVARLPPGSWNVERVRRAADGPAAVVVEAPLDDPLAQQLGVVRSTTTSQDGALMVADKAVADRAASFGMGVGCTIERSPRRTVAPESRVNWDSLGTVPISAPRAEAWRTPGWDAFAWEIDDRAEVLARYRTPELTSPALIRVGSITAWSFSAFAYLGQRHSSEPYEVGTHRVAPRTGGLEAVLLALIDESHRAANANRARVLPWPQGVRWVRSVRHDFDRPLGAERAEDVLERHRRAGTRSTWYWRARHAGDDAFAVVRDEGRHEIAHHTERPWCGADEEQQTLERAAARRMLGTSAHGAIDSFRYQGAPNVLWAEHQGLAYTEFLQGGHLHPHRFAALDEDGLVAPLQVLCLPHHESLEFSTGELNEQRIRDAPERYARARGLLQVMNHPDKNIDELFAALDAMPSAGRADWTAADAADWWRRTHVRDHMRVRVDQSGRIDAWSQHGADGVVVDVLRPDGVSVELVLDLPPGLPVAAAVEPTATIRADLPADRTWAEAASVYQAAIRDYHARHGRDPDSAAVASTVRVNTDLVPPRGDRLLQLLNDMTGTTMEGQRVLEVGSGFGALATYLVAAGRPEEVVATDIRSDFVTLAAECAEQTPQSAHVRFVKADMRDLTALGEEPFQLIVANNSFIYLSDRRGAAVAAREFYRVLSPGGHVLFYHANKWRRNDPFTGAPLVHLLTPRLAAPISRVTGWRHSHGRVRLVSPLELRRLLKRSGFRDVHIVGFGRRPRSAGIRRFFGDAYALSARKPPDSG
jgi:SAM-dependent methyltransferase